MRPRISERGFSLVETLVALAVIAGMSAMMFEAISTNAHATQRVARKRAAILLARSLLAQAMLDAGPGQLGKNGRSDEFAWRFTRRSIGQGARDEGLALEEVRIDVLEPATGRQLTSVRTLRLAR